MKTIKMLMMAVIFIMALSVSAQEKAGKKDILQHTTLYSCKMHPDVKMDKAGKCPQCGMELILSPKEKMKRDVTKNYACPIHADVISKKPGKCSKCNKDLVLSPKEKMKMEAVKAYSCPMKCEGDKTYDKPGKCPKCNMDLTEKKKDDHSGHQH
jgi:Cu(I)/Ag(I) efflux system membrane fusion protein